MKRGSSYTQMDITTVYNFVEYKMYYSKLYVRSVEGLHVLT